MKPKGALKIKLIVIVTLTTLFFKKYLSFCVGEFYRYCNKNSAMNNLTIKINYHSAWKDSIISKKQGGIVVSIRTTRQIESGN